MSLTNTDKEPILPPKTPKTIKTAKRASFKKGSDLSKQNLATWGGITKKAYQNLKSLHPTSKSKLKIGQISKFKQSVLKVLQRRGTRFSKVLDNEKEFGFNATEVTFKPQ